MFFHEQGLMKLEEVDFACFSNVTVLKLSCYDFSPRELELDLRGLKHLKSLELDSGRDSLDFVRERRLFQSSVGLGGLSSLSKLIFLRWSYVPADSPCIDEISRLTKLQVLDLLRSRRLPDLSSLVLLRVACFRFNDTAKTISGLSSKHTNICYLDLEGCKALQSCPGVGELIALQELRLRNCSKLKKVPNLQKLKRLRKLDVSCCYSLTALPGLGDLVSLLELDALACGNLVELPDVRNLINLRILDLRYCNLIKSLPGLDELVCLQSLDTQGCGSLTKFLDMRKLANLQSLVCDPDRPLQSSAGLNDLILLRKLHIGFSELRDWPNLRKLTKLETLNIAGWQVQRFSNFVLLESVTIRICKGVRVLPDLQKMTRLYSLQFSNCEFEDMSSLSNLTRLEDLRIMDCDKLEAIPDLRKLVRLKSLQVERCARLRDFRGVLALRNLETLRARGHPWLYENMGPVLRQLTSLQDLDVSYGGFADLQAVAACSQLHTLICCGCPIQEFPDLANFPKLRSLEVCDCVNLTKLTCTGPLSADFCILNVKGCRSLRALPDLSNARGMYTLNVAKSGVVMSPQFIMLAKARWPRIQLYLTGLPAAGEDGEAAPQQTVDGVAVNQPILSKLLSSMLRWCTIREEQL